jgi:soluble lytic murein transglycosylase
LQNRKISRKRMFWQRAVAFLCALVGLLGIAGGASLLLKRGFDAYYRRAYPIRYEELIGQACEERSLDPALVLAVVHTESRFRPDAVSSVGALGLMQMMPDAYNWVRMRRGEPETDDFSPLFDPPTSIDYGTEMLRMLLDEFRTVDNALAAYHGGWGSVKQWLDDPEYAPDGENVTNIPFADTRAYVERVNKTMEIYRRLYGL